MPLREVLAGAGVLEIRGDASTSVTGVAYASGRVAPGDLFACVRGAKADGHDFAGEAVDKGAIALLVEQMLDHPVPQARVPSTRRGMALAAHELFGRPSEKLSLVGVTGTNGKTTTTYLIESMAAASGRVSGRIGTTGAAARGKAMALERTTPEGPDFHRLLAAMVDDGIDIVAAEVSSHALALHRVDGARFAVAAFTNLTRDHLEMHKTMDAYFEAKARLFTKDFSDRAAVVVDDEWGTMLAMRAEEEGLDVWRVSVDGPADVAATAASLQPDGSDVTLSTPAGPLRLRIALPGPFNVANAALAAAASLCAGLPLEGIEAGAGAVAPGRFERVPCDGGPTVIVDYAHTPGGLESVLTAARALAVPPGRLIAVFGAGGDRDPGKRGPMGEAAGRVADSVIVTNDNPRSEDPATIAAAVADGVAATGAACEVILDRREAIRQALASAAGADVVVIAGKGHETGQDIGGRVVPFDDRAVAAEELARLR